METKDKKIYKIKGNKIVINDLSCFCIKHILECGQVFRFERLKNLENSGVIYCYLITSLDKIALVKEYENHAEILTKHTDYFVNYFDLDTDYNEIKNKLKNDKILCQAMTTGYGIRILKQDPLEMVISFIISANNNIKRIQKSLQKIAFNFGNKVDDSIFLKSQGLLEEFDNYYAFPTLEQLEKISQEDFKNVGVGFRDKYLFETIKTLKNINFENIKKLETNEQINYLTKLKGIGTKVADCILLFGLYNMQVFPVDTWVKKIYNSYYNTENGIQNDVKIIRKNLTDKFGDLSGYAQQYLFYFKRELEKQ